MKQYYSLNKNGGYIILKKMNYITPQIDFVEILDCNDIVTASSQFAAGDNLGDGDWGQKDDFDNFYN